MASLFGHAAAAGALGQAAPSRYRADWRFWYMAVFCACLPDVDVVGFRFGVDYLSMWGHRGITHSLLFALLIGGLAAARFRPDWRKDGWKLAAILVVVTASHGILDAFTNGGRGVAFFAPFDRARYFFPWTPIQVSPIGARRFFSARGAAVMKSELVWIWAPALVVGAALRALSNRRT
jgi:inner membrane protein